MYRTLQEIEKCRFNVSPEARTCEILCKPTEEQNQQMTLVDNKFICGLSALYQRDEKRSFSLAADQWTIVFFVSVNPFHARHVRGKPGHTTGGLGLGACRVGSAGMGKTGCQQNYAPRKQASLKFSKTRQTNCFNIFLEARTSESLFKMMGEQNLHVTNV